MRKIYIFGYGSLVNYNSRKDITKKSIKSKKSRKSKKTSFYASIHKDFGYIRSFNVRLTIDGIKQTMLGIEKVDKIEKKLTFPINGVLFQVTSSQLKKLDQRESEYRRIIVNKKFIKTDILLHENDIVYIYKPKVIFKISCNYPVCQDYLNMCLEGFAEYGEKAMIDFLKGIY
jgi:hypothetical protein